MYNKNQLFIMKTKDYSAPVSKVFEIIPQSVICQSSDGVMFGGSGRAGTDYDNNNIDDYGDL